VRRSTISTGVRRWGIVHTLPDLAIGRGQVLLLRTIAATTSDRWFSDHVSCGRRWFGPNRIREAGIPTFVPKRFKKGLPVKDVAGRLRRAGS
jgi:hypothetical protein